MGSISLSLSLSLSLSTATPIRFKPLSNHLNITPHKSRIDIRSNYGLELKSKLDKYSFSLLGPKRRIGSSGGVVVACDAKDSSGPPEENKALETVLKLYDALKNKNDCMISDVISEDCLCISNFVSTFQSFHGKKQVLAFFSYLMKTLGNNIAFVVQPTLDDGMNVGITWKLEWDKVSLPLGKGFSFYTCHIYQGKLMIKNVEIFMEPLIHLEPFGLRIINSVMNAMEKMNPQALFRNNERWVINIFFMLLFLAVMAFFVRPYI